MEKKRQSRSTGTAAFYAALGVCLLAAGVGTWQLLRKRPVSVPAAPPQIAAVSALPDTDGPLVETLSPEPAEPEAGEEEEPPAPVREEPVTVKEPVRTAPEPVRSTPEPVRNAPAEEPVRTVSAPAVITAEPEVPAESVPEEPEVEEPRIVIHPLEGETVAAFSMDALAYNETLADWRTHDGMDIAAEEGTEVLSACAGTVAAITDDPLMGVTVVLSHDEGYETTYASLRETAPIEAGDHVPAGTALGAVGSTAAAEASQGPHLHFSVKLDGEPVDPEEFLSQGTGGGNH